MIKPVLTFVFTLLISLSYCQYDNTYSSPDGMLVDQNLIAISDGGKVIAALETCFNAGGSVPIEGCNQKFTVIKLDQQNNQEWILDLPVSALFSDDLELYEDVNGDITIIYQFGAFQGCQEVFAGFTPNGRIAISKISKDGELISFNSFPEDCSLNLRAQKQIDDDKYLVLGRFDTRINNSFASIQSVQVINTNGEILNEFFNDRQYKQPKITIRDGIIEIFHSPSNNPNLFIERYDQVLNLVSIDSIDITNTILSEQRYLWDVQYFPEMNKYIIVNVDRDSNPGNASEIITLEDDLTISSLVGHQFEFSPNFTLDNEDRIITHSIDFSLDTLGDTKVNFFTPSGEFISSEIINNPRVEAPEDIAILVNGDYAIAGNIDCCHGNPDGPAKTFLLEIPELQLLADCPSQFRTQSQIDEFSGSCTSIDTLVSPTFLNDGTDPITNLNGFANITYIEGTIDLSLLSDLNDVSGLDAVEVVNGNLILGALPQIENFGGFKDLRNINGDLQIQSANFSEISGFGLLEDIQGDLSLESNPNLQSIIQLGQLETLSNITINDNPVLDNLDFLSSITTNSSHISITSNTALENLAGLENLSKTESFTIENNENLNSISQLQNLTALGSTDDSFLNIASNLNLSTLSGLENLDMSTVQGLTITGNSNLSICDLDNICGYLSVSDNDATIIGNDQNCSTRSDIVDNCFSVSTSSANFYSTVSVYPNPTRESFYVEGIEKAEFYILDMLGQQVQVGQIVSTSQVSIKDLSPGAYMLNVVLNGTNYPMKIVKIK